MIQKILITGSEGFLGKLISNDLKKDYGIIGLDKKEGVDILRCPFDSYFQGVKTVIHLAACPNPFIGKEEALENIEIASRVIGACKKSNNIERIINASSMNVYPYIDLFESGVKLTNKTPLSPNLRFGDGEYGKAKINVERMFEKYCRESNKSLLNLRLGYVTKTGLPYVQEDGHVEPIDYEIYLKKEDFVKIINKGIMYEGMGSYVCVSKRNGFVEESVRFKYEKN